MLLTLQVFIAFGVLAGMSLYPPAKGRLLVVPLLDRDTDAAARLALSAGSALLGRGPLPGSWVVVGERERIARQAGRWGMLVLAAPPGGCGGGDRAVIA